MLKYQYLILVLILFGLPNNTVAGENSTMSCDQVKLIFRTPIETFRSYLNAVLCDDFDSAEKCWTISDENKSGALDVISGLWVTYHKFNRVVDSKFGIKAKEIINTDCTDEAIALTLDRLTKSNFSIKDEKAVVIVNWEKGDGDPNAAFFYSTEIHFLKEKDGWKIDANERIGLKDPSEFFEPGGWGAGMLYQMKVYKNIIKKLENGEFATFTQFRDQLEKEFSVVETQWLKDHHCPRVNHKK